NSLLSKNKINADAVKQDELEQISTLSSPNEVLAICHYFEHKKWQVNFNSQISFYLDNIRDPGNLGTIIRLCSWFGISDLFCSPGTVELYNSKCIQASMGAFYKVNVHYLPINTLIEKEKIKNIYATLLSGSNIYKEKIINGLIIIGNEANGISEEVQQVCTKKITIPSADNSTESLNAAIAASIIASEHFRNKF
ncbi:MAG: RNA methyltransferase, partial [Bacteroidia bacterium]|nr:RNA methyltransferase [Bacteroidia bacterium]